MTVSSVQSLHRWPRPKRCQADTGGKHRWEYAKDRTSRTCRKCGTARQTASDIQSPAYHSGRVVGELMAAQRADGDFSYDCRWDLADAARESREYFDDFRRGLDDGLKA